MIYFKRPVEVELLKKESAEVFANAMQQLSGLELLILFVLLETDDGTKFTYKKTAELFGISEKCIHEHKNAIISKFVEATKNY